MESINVVVDDEEVERPSSEEENQLDSVDPIVTATEIIKASPSVSPVESPSTPTTSDTIASASENEDTLANPPKRSWVKLNHPPQQLRNRVIQPTRQDCARPDIRLGPSGRFTLKIWNLRKICKKYFFPKVSFRTRMYNQLIKQSNSIAKICRDINES